MVSIVFTLTFQTVSLGLTNGLTNSIQIWHVVVTGFQGVPCFKVTLNSCVLKSYVEFTLFFHRVYWK